MIAKECRSGHKEFVFHGQQPPRQGLGRIPGDYRNADAGEHRAAVQFRGDEVNACPVVRITDFQNPKMRVQAPVTGEKRRVDIDHSPRKAFDQRIAQDPHETGHYDQVSVQCIEGQGQVLLEGGAVGVPGPFDGYRIHTGGPGPVQSRRFGSVTDYRHDPGRQPAIADGIKQGLEIGAPPGDQNGQGQGLRHESEYWTRLVSPASSTTRPMTGAGSGNAFWTWSTSASATART